MKKSPLEVFDERSGRGMGEHSFEISANRAAMRQHAD